MLEIIIVLILIC